MKLFMIFLLPITLVYVLTKNAYPAGRPDIRYSAAIVGFLTGVVYAFIECVFTSSYYLIPYAFFPNYFSHLAFEVLIPCIFCLAACLVFVKVKKENFIVLYFVLAAFYSVFMPARIIHRNTVFDWYLLFQKPIVYTCMLFGIKNTVLLLYGCLKLPASFLGTVTKKTYPALRPAAALSACMLIPPALDVMHLLSLPVWLVLTAGIVYGAAAGVGTYIWYGTKKY